jgi:hypothetical protein
MSTSLRRTVADHLPDWSGRTNPRRILDAADTRAVNFDPPDGTGSVTATRDGSAATRTPFGLTGSRRRTRLAPLYRLTAPGG